MPDWGEPDEGELDGGEPDQGEQDGSAPYGRETDELETDGSAPYGRQTDELETDGRELGDLTYWRRRFVALTVGLGVLSLIAWAFSGTIGASGAGGTTADGAKTSHERAGRATAGSSGSVGAAQPGVQPHASASVTAQPSASVQPLPSVRPSASPAAGAQAQAGSDAPEQLAAFAPQRSMHPARACKPGDVVLSLFVGQDSYVQGQLPEFDVDVVSTGTRTCGFNVGAKHLSLVVRAHGKRVWASVRCATGHGTLTTNLARGVPVIVPVSWNRQTSALACQDTGQQAPAGRYTASASDGGVASNPVRFTIS